MSRSGAVRTGANLIADPYTGEHEAEKVRPRLLDLLLEEQVLSPAEAADEHDLDAPAPGVTAPDAALPPRPGVAPDDSAMLRRLASTRHSALAWLRRNGQ